MQSALDGTSIRRWDQFGSREIGFEEIVGQDEATGLLAIEQMMAA